MDAGDLAMAAGLPVSGHPPVPGRRETAYLAVGLLNLAACLGQLGQVGPGQDAAAEALTCAETVGDWDRIRGAHAFKGSLAALTGDTAGAEQQLLAADQISR